MYGGSDADASSKWGMKIKRSQPAAAPGDRVPPVGASLLAKNLRAARGVRILASSLTSIASNRASTGCSYR
ncbi:hypothetical protein EMIT0P218_110090 [Pseudomonas sp. IT-P218]